MERKKKLLITASTFPRWNGDTEPRFILDYAKAINKYFDVTVLVPAAIGAEDKEVLEDVKIERYHYFPIHKWETLCYPGAIVPRIKEKKIRILLVPFLIMALRINLKRRIDNYDIVHANWIIPQGIVQSTLNKPFIITGHGGDISSMNKGIMKIIKRKSLEKATAVVVVSKYKDKELHKYYPNIETSLISMGVDLRLFNKEHNFRENYFHQENKKVILFVGRLAEIKGVEYLIEAVNCLDNVLLVICGDGPLKQKLLDKAKENYDKIVFLGSKTHNELAVIYASADVLVVPSISDSKGAQEGLPTVILEAMASELPVIATKTGGIGDVIRNEHNGILIEQKSTEDIIGAINKIINSEELRKKIILEEKNTIKNYDYDVIAQKYLRLFEKKSKDWINLEESV